MQTLKQYITQASSQLNDQRYNRAFTRWGRDLLIGYLNLGLTVIASYFPGEFNRVVPVALKTGRFQTIGDIDSINSIINIQSSDGTPVSKMDKVLSDTFAAYDVCGASLAFVNGSPEYSVLSYAVDAANPRNFIVEPSVPNGVNVTLNVVVDGAVPQFSLEDWDDEINIPSKYQNPLMDFMLAKANNMNQDSASSQHIGDTYITKFYRALGINYTQLSRFNSGYYLGNKGNGDPRLGASNAP